MEQFQKVIDFLADEYKFDRKEAREKVRKFQKSSKPKTNKMSQKPKICLPFCGKIREDWCQGVRTNHKLFTQCTGKRMKNGEFCKTCQKQADANNGTPKRGVVASLPNQKPKIMQWSCKGST